MKRINPESLTNVKFEMHWKSLYATHTEIYEAQGLNMWRDCLPETLLKELAGKTVGETITAHFEPGVITSTYDPRKTFVVKLNQFNRHFIPAKTIKSRIGRFYPKGLLKDVAGVFPQNFHPFRLVGIQNGQLEVDFNHPLAKAAIQLRTSVKKIGAGAAERGGRCHDWSEIIADGPGMQARWENRPTDFFSGNPLRRKDESPDQIFYEQPRLVQHIDDTAIQGVKDLYGQFLRDGMRVLDLMSSWQSHIPSNLRLEKLTGLGLNREELDENEILDDRVVHDLNANPVLPFETGEFDAVICTVSVEYLIHPEMVFNELGRVLRPDGLLIVTFSNRWFPPKVIRIWEELHEFERMGLVLEYFIKTGKFKDLETFSARGLPRPWDDRYFPEKRYSDPIYAVWGRKEFKP
ncbi:methyltransferase domain-containing protein [Thermodesulfobacteriota bacterium]